MNFLELTRKRCSIRSYIDRKVEPEKIRYILEAGRMAPSAVNKQPWHVLLIESEAERQQLQSCYNREWFKSAPLISSSAATIPRAGSEPMAKTTSTSTWPS